MHTSLVFKIVATEEWRSAEAAGAFKAGQQLVKFAHDLGLRVDVFKLETNPDEQIERHRNAASGLRSHCWPDSQAHAENQLQRVSFPPEIIESLLQNSSNAANFPCVCGAGAAGAQAGAGLSCVTRSI